MHELFDGMRRWPDVEAPNLHAVDASDRLILDEAIGMGPLPRDVVVIGDRYGALTLGALASGAQRVRVHQDALTGERALGANAARAGIEGFAHHDLGVELVEGASLVLVQLPRALDALDEIAALVAAHASADVRLVAGGRIKHMSHAMNDVLRAHFGALEVSRARQKSRVLHASDARGGASSWPRTERHGVGPTGSLVVAAHGGAFAGTSIDIGTRALLAHVERMPESHVAIDLACGTGVLATALALAQPRATVIASDQSAAAVRSAAATVAANGVAERVRVVRDDGLQAQPDESADLVVLNPPFHIGAAVHTGIAWRLFADAGRVLRPGGELWAVWNSHLGYRQALERLVGPTRQVERTPKFTITVSTRA